MLSEVYINWDNEPGDPAVRVGELQEAGGPFEERLEDGEDDLTDLVVWVPDEAEQPGLVGTEPLTVRKEGEPE